MTPCDAVPEPDWALVLKWATEFARFYCDRNDVDDVASIATARLYKWWKAHCDEPGFRGAHTSMRAMTKITVRRCNIELHKGSNEATTDEGFEERIPDPSAAGGCATPEEAVLRDEREAWETRLLELRLAAVEARLAEIGDFACPIHAERGRFCPEQELIRDTARAVIGRFVADAHEGVTREVRERDFRLAAVGAGAPEEVMNLASTPGRSAARKGWMACVVWLVEVVFLAAGEDGESLLSRYPEGLAGVVREAGDRVAAAQRSARTWSAHDDEVMGEWLDSRGLHWQDRVVG